jgi:membrane-associated phospholipid phosphatase
VDAAGNACPSLHVATAAFTALWVEHVLRRIGAPRWLRACNGLWVGAIVWSTMATKQHVAWDVAGGLLLAVVFAALSLAGRGGTPKPV